jgi:drug/metabolite transporter (DMT)-like permease
LLAQVPPLALAGLLYLGAGVGLSVLRLNLEGVFTAVLAWLVFHENVDRRIATGFFVIVAAGVLLSWEGTPAAEPAGSRRRKIAGRPPEGGIAV